MGLYNFQQRFVPFVLSGAKRHTIRATRAHPDRPGNTLRLYTGLRTKWACLLMRTPCIKVEEITIEMRPPKRTGVLTRGLLFPGVSIDGQKLASDELEALAWRDGFSSFHEMVKFWTSPSIGYPSSARSSTGDSPEAGNKTPKVTRRAGAVGRRRGRALVSKSTTERRSEYKAIT
jgi:hypothetical protein